MSKRYTNDELHMRLIFVIGVTLAITFLVIVCTSLYMVTFVSQPMTQAPNDKEILSLLNTLSIFLTGTLSGLVGSSAIKKTASRISRTPKKPVEDKQVTEGDANETE